MRVSDFGKSEGPVAIDNRTPKKGSAQGHAVELPSSVPAAKAGAGKKDAAMTTGAAKSRPRIGSRLVVKGRPVAALRRKRPFEV